MCDMCSEVKAKHDCDAIEFEQKVAILLDENESLKELEKKHLELFPTQKECESTQSCS